MTGESLFSQSHRIRRGDRQCAEANAANQASQFPSTELRALRVSAWKAGRLHARCTELAVIFGLCLLVAAPVSADLQKAMAETNLEKRSKLALDNALAVYQSLRDDYSKGDAARVAADAKEIGESVHLAYDSLTQMGKDPRKASGPYKRAELETRDLARRLETFEQDMNMEDRDVVEKLKNDVQQVHENLLLGLLEGRKK